MQSAVKKNIALLIFANSPEAERERKAVGNSDEIFAQLTEHSLKLARQLQIPFFHFTEKEQVGTTFGERYTHAMKSLFAQGYDGLITIGNDTPALTISQLKTALASLINGKTVIGPSKDGGYYLLAISRDAFSETALRSVSWNTHKVFAQVVMQLRERQQQIQVLQSLVDLDTTSDVALAITQNRFISIGIYKLLLRCLPKQEVEITFPKIHFPLPYKGRFNNRGSPVFPL